MIPGRRSPALWLLVGVLCLAVGVRAQAPDVSVDQALDTLVYKDGDRIHGHVVQQKDDVIVFKSERFGVLRVKAADVVVIKAEKHGETKPVVAEGIHAGADVRAEQDKVKIWDLFSPAVLTAKVRDIFGPWHGHLAFSNEVVTDTSHRDNLALEGKLSRKFKRDVVDLTARYDYDQTNGEVTTDMAKAVGSWRHDFNRLEFGIYRPTIEWNQANQTRTGFPTQYVLLQQEFGLGLNVWSRPAQKFRVGVSENVFDLWSYVPGAGHQANTVESLFDEVELALPWRMTLSQRGVWYPVSSSRDGWEDQIELNKKLTETLSVALRHEIRRRNPDGSTPDYTRLKLLLGLDF